MATPLRYKADSEAALGEHLGRGGGRPGPPLPLLQASTQQLFAAEGARFFLAGGMFRGAPARCRHAGAESPLPGTPRACRPAHAPRSARVLAPAVHALASATALG